MEVTKPYLIQKALITKYNFLVAQVMSIYIQEMLTCPVKSFDADSVDYIWFKPNHAMFKKSVGVAYWDGIDRCLAASLLFKKKEDNTLWFAINIPLIDELANEIYKEEIQKGFDEIDNGDYEKD